MSPVPLPRCGNYLDQNLPMANWLARRYLDRDLADIDEKHLHAISRHKGFIAQNARIGRLRLCGGAFC